MAYVHRSKFFQKVLVFLLVLLVAWSAGPATVTAQPQAPLQMPEHPRILLLQGEEATIRKSLAADSSWRAVHEMLLEASNQILLEALPERVMEGRRMLTVARNSLRRIFYLSYAWRISGEEKYRRRAEQELLRVSQFSDWNPSHFLDVAEMTMGVALGYDWLYPTLSDSSKRIIKEALLKKGLEPSLDPRYNQWLQDSHNWNQVGNAGMLYGALAIWEDAPALAQSIVERAVKTVVLPMQAYGPDGAYPEGYSYWGYGTSFNVMLISALEKVWGHDFGLSAQPGFLKTAGYLLHMTGPSGEAFNYSDSGPQGGLQPAMFWFAQKLQDPTLLWGEKMKLARARAEEDAKERLLPAMMLWHGGIRMDEVKPPQQTFWAGRGETPVALMRTSWTNPAAIFVGLKGGTPMANHGHMDAGSFVLDALGTRWAMDFGTENYTVLEANGVKLWNNTQNSERWKIFRYNNFTHNTLTVDGHLQHADGFAPLISWSGKANFKNVVTDLVLLYPPLASALRGVALVDEQYVVVRDELAAAQETVSIRWTMLTAASVELKDNQTAVLRRGNKQLLLRVNAPNNVRLKTWPTTPPTTYEMQNLGTTLVGFEVQLEAGKNAVLEVVLIPDGDKPKKPIAGTPLAAWPK